jgi:amidophosphoribosyltransferase
MDNLVKSCCASKDRFCTACFEGQYPIEVPEDLKLSKYRLEKSPA